MAAPKNKHGIDLTCSCGYEWKYDGHAPRWACCPSCRNQVSLKGKLE